MTEMATELADIAQEIGAAIKVVDAAQGPGQAAAEQPSEHRMLRSAYELAEAKLANEPPPSSTTESESAASLGRRPRDAQRRAEITAELEQQHSAELAELAELRAAKQRAPSAGDDPQQALLNRIGNDMDEAIRRLALDPEDARAAREAPTIADRDRIIWQAGVRAQEGRLALMEAELKSLRGRAIATSGPSPLAGNGTNGRGTLPAGATMQDIGRQVAAELGINY